MPADVEERPQRALPVADEHDGNLPGVRRRERARLGDLTRVADVLPEAPEDPLVLELEHVTVGVPAPGQRSRRVDRSHATEYAQRHAAAVAGAGLLRDAESLVRSAAETLRPLTLARNVSWWDSNMDATDENSRRRAEAELAFSDALADRELFAAIESARANGAGPSDARSLELLRNAMRPTRSRARCVSASSSSSHP